MGSLKPVLRTVAVKKTDVTNIKNFSDEKLQERQSGFFKDMKNATGKSPNANKSQDIYSNEIRRRRKANTFISSNSEPLG